MPILKYHCDGCGKEFAKIVLKPENAAKKCPVCGIPDPVEIGPAFHEDMRPPARAMCGSCDACGIDSCC